jgi:phospholipid/cholesterol/gamma-HCH transport system substrate-binding protein
VRQNVIETVLGAVVLVAAAFFLYFAYSTSQLRAVEGYEVSAQFDRIDGIRDGSDVRISGIKVGSVLSTKLDPKTYLATVTMSVDPAYKLPEDTVAEVLSAGLLGNEYMALVPGGSRKMIPPGGRILYTQAPVNIENLIGKYMFSPHKGAAKGAPSSLPGPGAQGFSPSPSPRPAPAGK